MKHLLSRALFIVPLLLACSLVSSPMATAAPTAQPDTAVPPTEEAPAEPTATHIAIDLTPAQMAAIQALAADEGYAIEDITVVSTEAVDWPNGCLGVDTGEPCTEAIVPGFRIILSAGGEQYEYRTNQDGTVVVAAAEESPDEFSLQVAVRRDDRSIVFVDTGVPFVNAASLIPGLQPLGGAVGDSVYMLNLDNVAQIQRVDANGVTPLDLGVVPNYALAVWPGDDDEQARLAFGTSPIGDSPQSQLYIANADGSNLVAVVTEQLDPGAAPYQLLAQRWSLDGQSLFFSREPYGIGGYIPFSGASSLYRYDLATQSVTELIPFDPATNFLCLGDLSPDVPLRAVGNCVDRGAITVHNLAQGNNPGSPIAPPAEAGDYTLVGSARFDRGLATRMAFAMARADPANEQGWAALYDPDTGETSLLATSEPGTYYTVAGWLDDGTILLQQIGASCGSACPNSLWTVGLDGGNLTKLTDGLFVAFVGGQ